MLGRELSNDPWLDFDPRATGMVGNEFEKSEAALSAAISAKLGRALGLVASSLILICGTGSEARFSVVFSADRRTSVLLNSTFGGDSGSSI